MLGGRIIEFLIFIFNKFISILDYVNNNNEIVIIKYLIIYLVILMFIYCLIIIYELVMNIIKKILTRIIILGCSCKKLRVAIIFNKINNLIDNLFYKITFNIFEGFDLCYTRNSLEPYYCLFRSLFLHRVTLYISAIILVIYSNYVVIMGIKDYIIDDFKDILSLNNIIKLFNDIWNIQLEKIKILATIILLFMGTLYIISNLISKRYLEYAEFEISLKELEKAKIKNVVVYQEEILEILMDMYYNIEDNLKLINNIYKELEQQQQRIYCEILKEKSRKSYYTYGSNPFKYDIENLKDYSNNFKRLDEIIKKMEEEKSIKVYKNYNKEFGSECIRLGLFDIGYKYFGYKRLEICKLTMAIETYFENIDNLESVDEFERLQWSLKSYRNDTIRYYIDIKSYVNKFEKRRNKIMKYSEFNSKLKGIEERFKVFK